MVKRLYVSVECGEKMFEQVKVMDRIRKNEIIDCNLSILPSHVQNYNVIRTSNYVKHQ